MNTKLISGSLIILCIALALAAGCSSPPQPPVTPSTTPPTTLPITTPTSVTTTTLSTPGPTQTLPPNYNVQFQVQSNGEAIDPQIIVTLNGGMGMNLIVRADIKITRSDGIVETDTMTQPLHKGDTRRLTGTTKNNDRCEIWVTTPNLIYKVYDQYVPFRTYN